MHLIQEFCLYVPAGELGLRGSLVSRRIAGTSLPSGLPLAVTSFNRFSRLVEALSRCRVLVSLYFDDATITDLKSSKGSGQWAANQLCTLIGSPSAADKKQPMQNTETFLAG